MHVIHNYGYFYDFIFISFETFKIIIDFSHILKYLKHLR